MEELISRLVANTGIDKDVAEKAIVIVLKFLNSDGPQDLVPKLFEAFPGASEVLETETGGGGVLGGLAGMMGGGAMQAMTEMTQAGLGMGEVQGVTKEIVAYAKEKAGDELVDEILGQIPGLGQFV